MKRWMTLLTLVTLCLATTAADAQVFGRRPFFYRSYRSIPGWTVHSPTLGGRTGGHTEATGLGTAVDGVAGRYNRVYSYYPGRIVGLPR